MFAVLNKTEILIYESNIFFRKMFWQIFSGKLTSLIVCVMNYARSKIHPLVLRPKKSIIKVQVHK